MGEAFDREGNVLGSATGSTKAEVAKLLDERHPTAHEIRVRDLIEKREDVSTAPRQIEIHHDGHGLNESITIRTDKPDGSGAAHAYELLIDGESIGRVQFQKGPRNEATSTPGATEAALYAILIDRLQGFQGGPYSCRENAIQLTKLEECLMWTKERAHARARRGVLGTNAR